MTKLYKYRSNFSDSSGVRRDTQLLLSSQLYASPYKNLNDPFEGSVRLPKSTSCEKWTTPLIQDLSNAGVCSLSRQKDNESFPSNEIMWSLYADGHKGFCIEYDLEKLTNNYDNEFDIRSSITVNYEDQTPEVRNWDDIFDVQKKVFGTKSKAWSSENEFRLVFTTSGLKPISQDSVSAIYLGLRTEYNERNVILNEMIRRGIPVYQMIRQGEAYSLRAVRIDIKSEYEILNEKKIGQTKTYNIIWKSENTDRWSLKDFIISFKRQHGECNINIINDIQVLPMLDKFSSQCNETEARLIQEHWLAYSSFDVGDEVWYYPEAWWMK